MPEALPLVTCDDAGVFAVNPSTVDVLATFPAPLSVVCVTGLFRTGKSFLLNRVILREPVVKPRRGGRKNMTTTMPPGFGVGSTVQACTKGIWMWSEPLEVNGVHVVVLDTEGSGSPAANATHDTRVFSLGLLLSTVFVYNSVGRIDDAALSTLNMVTHITAELQEDTATLPAFLWVLRDFALQLTDASGSTTDPNAYMEGALAGDRQDARAHIRKFFPTRECWPLVRPCTNEADLQQLNTLSDASLRPEFVTAAVALRARVMEWAAARPVTHQNVTLSGSMWAAVVHKYVDAVNAGGVPHIADAWESVCAVRQAELERVLFGQFATTLSELPRSGTPVEFDAAVDAAVAAARATLAPTPPSEELAAFLHTQATAAKEAYTATWRTAVFAAATTMVDTLVHGAPDHPTWSAFWESVESAVATFERTHGCDDVTAGLMHRALFRLWEAVPAYFGDRPVTAAQLEEVTRELTVAQDQLEEARLAADRDAASWRTQLDGAARRVASAEEDAEEARVALSEAQAELTALAESRLLLDQRTAEVRELTSRVEEAEAAVVEAEEETARRVDEINAEAMKTMAALKELRVADVDRLEAEVAAAQSATAAAEAETERVRVAARRTSGELESVRAELSTSRDRLVEAGRATRRAEDAARTAESRTAELERQLADADERARKRPRTTPDTGDGLKLVRAEAELNYLRTQHKEATESLATYKSRVTELEKQLRTVQRTTTETLNRERLQFETRLAVVQAELGRKK